MEYIQEEGKVIKVREVIQKAKHKWLMTERYDMDCEYLGVAHPTEREAFPGPSRL